jgi:hypothetical protein
MEISRIGGSSMTIQPNTELSKYQNGAKMATINKQGFVYVTTLFENGLVRSIIKSNTEEQAEHLAEDYVMSGPGPQTLLNEHIING